jgi:UDP-glucose 4-epimerase
MVNNRLSSRNFLCGLLCAAATLVHGSSAWISRHQRYNRAQASRVLPVWPAGGGDGESFVLVTGGAGYIGSHTCLELLKAGEKAVVVDNLCNSDLEALERVRKLAGAPPEALVFRNVDLCDKPALAAVFEEFAGRLESCIHFAGLKAVGESVAQPLRYYDNNIGGTCNLLELLEEHGCKRLVFSSSATVYGDPEELPIRESAALRSTNPYGRTKLFIEDILRDLAKSDAVNSNQRGGSSSDTYDGDDVPEAAEEADATRWRIMILRYFNPIGAHESGLIGEDPQGIPNNLMPFIAQVCVGRRKELSVFGGDYDTPDGTGVRDYIHVVDLALGHLAALTKLRSLKPASDPEYAEEGCCVPVNLGTGRGVSVLDLVQGMEAATDAPVPYSLASRRPGDVASCYCDPSFAKDFLGWEATRDVGDMCRDTWRWQSGNPEGYKSGFLY